MKNLQNNLHLECAMKMKNYCITNKSIIEKNLFSEEFKNIIKYLKNNKMFLNYNTNNIVNFDVPTEVILINEFPYSVENRDDITIVILNGEYLCPVYKKEITPLYPLYYDDELDMVCLSTLTVGQNIKYGNITDYHNNVPDNRICQSIEEIDINNFDPYDYYGVEKEK